MPNAADTLPNDIDELKSLVQSLQHENAEQGQRLEQSEQFIHQLLEQIKLSRHQHFGSRSERYSLDQMQRAFNEAEAAAAASAAASGDAADEGASASTGEDDHRQTVTSYKRRKGGRRPLPDTLPRVDVVHELDEAACAPATPAKRSLRSSGRRSASSST